ncbi:uncharacterized protein si:ch211-136m16.8 isoform X2 [Synchiropus splendidus]|uniref:uncharacterized protein si:ch211-136m16.8 isoform X2 n=1 Tax=Synchiropus splendidus TaxID=270530 RepID=UPI00237EA45B|nr:uncharacterized protein si:ch211-136m16.8 isoform X2 [Synchiropus splendidus]
MDPLSRAEGTFWTVWYYITGAVSRFLRAESNNPINSDPGAPKEFENHEEQEDPQREDSYEPESNVSASDPLVASDGDNETNDLVAEREHLLLQTLLAGSDGNKEFNEVEASQASLSSQPESVDAGSLSTDRKCLKPDIAVSDSDQSVCQDTRAKQLEKTVTNKREQASLQSEETDVDRPESVDDKDLEVEHNPKCLQINLEAKENLDMGTFLSHQVDDGKTQEEVAYLEEEADSLMVSEASKLEELRTETPHTLAVAGQEEDAHVKQLYSAPVLKTSVDFNGNNNKLDEGKSDSFPDALLDVDEERANKEGDMETTSSILTIPVKLEGEAGQEAGPETPRGQSEGHLIESQELNATVYEGALPELNNESELNENTAQWFLEAGDEGKEIQLPEEVENSSKTGGECVFAKDPNHRADSTFDRADESKNSCGEIVCTGMIAVCDTVQEAREILSDPTRSTSQLIGMESASPGTEPTADTFEKYCTEDTEGGDEEVPSVTSEQNSSGASSLQDDMTEFVVEPHLKSMTECVVDIQDAGIDMEEINCGYDVEAADDKRNEGILGAEHLVSEREAELLANTVLSKNPEPEDALGSNDDMSIDFNGSLRVYCTDEKAKLDSYATCEDTCATMLRQQDLTDEEIEDLWSCAALTEEPEKDTGVKQSSSKEGNENLFEGKSVASILDSDASSATSQLCLQDSGGKEIVDFISTGNREAVDKVDAGSSVNVSEMSSQQEQGDQEIKDDSPLEVDGAALDFVAQKCRIAVKNPNVRPPKNPRSLINMPSVTPLPVQPALGTGIPALGKALTVKLPGLGGGFQGLKTTKRTVDDDTTSQGAVDEEKSDGKKDAKQTPKWLPPRQFGNPLMAELKNKLKKTTDD